jgi:hypothetical protein
MKTSDKNNERLSVKNKECCVFGVLVSPHPMTQTTMKNVVFMLPKDLNLQNVKETLNHLCEPSLRTW